MKKCVFLTITENVPLTDSVYKMTLEGDVSAVDKPGQFVNIKVDGLYLRRPISVCDKIDNAIVIIYKVIGKGTEKMSRMKPGEILDVLCGLGNGFDTSVSGNHPAVIGGGVGVPPMYWLAKKLISEGKRVTAVLGFNTKSEIFYADEFEAIGCSVRITTADGSAGIRGFVTAAMDDEFSYVYACGPEPMLHAVYDSAKCGGQFSFEERMGCGFGACMGCTCKTKYGNKRICREGPVLVKEEIIW